MATIYLSSTYEDLKDYRLAVFEALQKGGHQVIAMEHSVTADCRPVEQCLQDVERADIYVGLFAFRYGYIPPRNHQNPKGLSITELEFRHAEHLKKTSLTFLMKDDASWSPSHEFYPSEDNGEQIRTFRQYLLREKLASFFSSPDNLAILVLAAMMKYQNRQNPNIENFLQAYRDNLKNEVGKVHLLGESESRPLEKVFVHLNVRKEIPSDFKKAQLWRMMDAEWRMRRSPSFESQVKKSGNSTDEKIRHPQDLLRGGMRGLIMGAPGSGKTTLLKHLISEILLNDDWLPVYLECKSISQRSFDMAGGDFIEILLKKGCECFVAVQAKEHIGFREFFISQLQQGKVALFLDGLDEIRNTDFFLEFLRNFEDFLKGVHKKNIVIMSSRPYALQGTIEGCQKFEILPLSSNQIRKFIEHYYGSDPSKQRVIQTLLQQGS